ncbi:MAG: hypothetical protein ABSD29_02770 [Verrucomicrobiota bacterium]|jgi:hypothetical protein
MNPGSPEICRRFPLSPSEGERAGVTYYHGKGGTGVRMAWGDRTRGEEF